MKDLLSLRFSPEENRRRDELWRVLCASFLQRYVSLSDRVLDLGCGDCLFLKHIRCGEKYGIDCSEGARKGASSDTKLVIRDAGDLGCFEDGFFTVVFASNFFEHQETRREVTVLLQSVHRVLGPGGRFLIIQPNIRAVGNRYWDYFDHNLALSDRGMSEALNATGFHIREMRSRFLPYTTKRAYLARTLLLRIYLRMRIAQRIFGGQMFICAEKPGGMLSPPGFPRAD